MTTTTVVTGRRRGATLLLGAQWVRYLSQLLGMIVLARLVGPAEFGVVALAGALAGFAAVLGDFGLSMAALRAPTLTSAQRTMLFWANTVIGTLATALVVVLAPPFAAVYGNPLLVPVLALLAPAFALRAMSAQFRVELNRSGRLGRLAAAELAGDLTGLVVAVLFAVLGGGALALASQGTVAAAITLLVAVVLTPWHPGLPRRGSDMKGLLTFGGHTFLVHALNYSSTVVGTLALGKVANDRTVGLFNRATQLVNLPIDQLITPLTRVVIPALADPSDPTPLDQRLAKYQTALSYPVLAYLSLFAVTAEPAIHLVFGGRWDDAAVYVPVLAIGAVFQTLGYPQYWAFVATGRSGLLLWCEAAGRVLMIALVVAAAGIGPLAIAAAMSIGQFALWVAAFVVLPRAGVSTVALLAASVRPIVVFSVAAAVASLLDRSFFTPLDTLPRLLATGGSWAIVVGVAVALVARRDLSSLWGAVRRR